MVMRGGMVTKMAGLQAAETGPDSMEWQIAAMRRTLQLMGDTSASDALRALRAAYPEVPLGVRVDTVSQLFS